MKLFNTMPLFERLKKELESDPAWKHLHVNQQFVIHDITLVCCNRKRPPSRMVLCLNKYGLPTGAAVWWFGRHYMKLGEDGNLDFVTIRPPTHGGPGWIGESFRAGPRFEYNIISFFNKIDRIKREAACAS